MKYIFYSILIMLILDLIFGDPYKMPHIVRLMGKIIKALECALYCKDQNSKKMKIRGGILVLIMIFIFGVLPSIVFFIIFKLNKIIFVIAEGVIGYQLIAARNLFDESMKVYGECKKNDIVNARKSVSMIVGRDTDSLEMEGVVKAAVETVAENTSDGVIAPLFYMCIGGTSLAMLYKAINTMDSMIGYNNDKYIDFGYYAAKTDDIANFIPSRITAICMIVGTLFGKYSFMDAVRIFKRDRFNHTSPNSAQSEAVIAGALQVRLAGDAYYFGKLYKKPYIGDDIRKVECDDIVKANKLMFLAETVYMIVYTAIWCAFLL